ncbi:Outer membrane protein OmpA [Loktanella sp. DSM 29012]|uniref:OmpA family protein n=1 Tax=Loktanella sp. DSM 29012 TaxID=1881056 RepID=UPI0008BF8117|nr:OmpA family protein [Loktanella sp. DSM 29012]SEP78980.1 Outer membrane protein OmpA [Loktanella sp. DSM 29012]
MKTTLILGLAALTVAGCSNRPAGMFPDEIAAAQAVDAQFGAATAANIQAMTNPQQATDALAVRFATEVESTVTFPFNSSVLTPQAQAVLQQQANWIRQFPEIRFRVYGHTDLVGSAAYNERLGRDRANAVVAYLATQGISRNRLEALVSFGETRPVVATQQPEMRNRRTVTEVSGFVAGSPMLLNGKYAQVVFREYVLSAVPTTEISATEGGAGGE